MSSQVQGEERKKLQLVERPYKSFKECVVAHIEKYQISPPHGGRGRERGGEKKKGKKKKDGTPLHPDAKAYVKTRALTDIEIKRKKEKGNSSPGGEQRMNNVPQSSALKAGSPRKREGKRVLLLPIMAQTTPRLFHHRGEVVENLLFECENRGDFY